MPRLFPWRRRAAPRRGATAAPTEPLPLGETRVVDGAPVVPPDYVPPDGPPGAVYEEVVEPEPGPARDLWPWLLLLAALVVGGLSFLYFLARGDDDEARPNVTTVVRTTPGAGSVAVPNLVGRRETAAVEALSAAGLQSRVERRASNRRRGIVFDQRPNAGRRVDRESAVTLFVSRGPAKGRVPDLVGDGVDDARRELTAAGLETRVVRVFSTEVVNLVVGQQPPGGSVIRKGATVTLRVSKGPRPVEVPSVVGQPRAAAEAALERVGLVANVFTVPAPDPEGTVVAQNPQPGQRAKRGSRVRINVSEGVTPTTGGTTTDGGAGTQPTPTTGTTTGAAPAIVSVPDVVGLNLSTATRRLRAVGLRPSVRRVPSTEPAGIVVAQAKRPGTGVRRGSAVGINVSRGPTQTGQTGQTQRAVPDVLGDDQATAQARLRAAGFSVRVVQQETTNPDEEGIVLEQQPAAGTRAAAGTQVTIFVGTYTGP